MAMNTPSGNWFSRLFKPTDNETTYLHKGEILVVFLIGFVLALVLWLLVNLGKEYNITLDVPIRTAEVSEEMAFAEKPPENATIGISGEGWKMLSLYRNPPEISIIYNDGEVNISDLVHEQLGTFPEVTVHKVEPASITLETVPKTSKRVPVAPNLDVRLRTQYEIMGDIRVRPDSVTVTGAETIIDTIQSWPTSLLRLRDIQDRVEREVPLESSDLQLRFDTSRVQVSFDVTEFTEGEIRIYVRARNVPEGWQVRFNPSVITVRYDVPIEHFSEAHEMVPFEAYVDYETIEQDTTGFVMPTVRSITDDLDLRLRSSQPRRVSYFRVVEE